LAQAAGVSLSTVRDFEGGRRRPMRQNLAAIRGALEAAGVEFLPEHDGGPGIRLAKSAGRI
jgi:hypothetical protein